MEYLFRLGERIARNVCRRKREISLFPPSYAYGEAGHPPTIPRKDETDSNQFSEIDD